MLFLKWLPMILITSKQCKACVSQVIIFDAQIFLMYRSDTFKQAQPMCFAHSQTSKYVIINELIISVVEIWVIQQVVPSTQYGKYSNHTMQFHYVVCSSQYVVHSMQYIVCSAQYVVHSRQYVVAQYLVCSRQYVVPSMLFISKNAYQILYTTYYILPTRHYILPTTYYVLPTRYYILCTMYYILHSKTTQYDYCIYHTRYQALPTRSTKSPRHL